MIDYRELINKYYDASPELKNILVAHSMQVRDRALKIVDAHPEWTANGEVDRDFIEEAAMLHDIGIIYCNAPKIFCYGTHQYIEHGYLGAELLRKEGLPKHALVAERHTGTGITMEQVLREELPIPARDYCPVSLEEKIVCYADKFYSKGHIGDTVNINKIRQQIWKYGHDAIVRWDNLVSLMSENLPTDTPTDASTNTPTTTPDTPQSTN